MTQLGPAKVYLGDDDAAIRYVLNLLLSLRGIDSVAFASGEETLEHIEPGARGCNLSDLRMLGLGGVELMKKMTGTRHPNSDRDVDSSRQCGDHPRCPARWGVRFP